LALHWGKAIGLRVSILASGSSGNITLLETESTRLLITPDWASAKPWPAWPLSNNALTASTAFYHSRTSRSLQRASADAGLVEGAAVCDEPTMDALQRTLPETLGKRLRGVEKSKRGSDFASRY